jgi:hypothetical protein
VAGLITHVSVELDRGELALLYAGLIQLYDQCGAPMFQTDEQVVAGDAITGLLGRLLWEGSMIGEPDDS